MPSPSFDPDQALKDAVILIAEDDDGHASLLERTLKRCGITQHCRRFRDGQEVLDFLLKLSKSTPYGSTDHHILFLDGRMPRISGQEVLTDTQTHRALQTLPLTIVTTTDDAQERESFQALGCTYHLNKPVEEEALQNLLRKVCRAS